MEHPVPADIAVLRLRRQLADLARQVAKGETPPALSVDVTNVRSHSGRMDDWREHVSRLNGETGGRRDDSPVDDVPDLVSQTTDAGEL